VSATKPVVVYGASGYTGRLVAEYLRELGVAFTAAGRDGARVRAAMERVPGIETADHQVVAVDHAVGALADLFDGAQVVCNTVGPFSEHGRAVVEACLEAGCHYLDTTGEQAWVIELEERWSQRFAERGLLLAPCTAQMFTTGEIAANICLETPGLDSLDILALWRGLPTRASIQTIYAMLMADHYYLEQGAYAPWPPAAGYEVAVPGQHEAALTLPWGGSAHPVWFRRDPRVANCKALGGILDRRLMEDVIRVAQDVEEHIRPLRPEARREALAERAASVRSETPPRESRRVNRSLDSVYASGPFPSVHCLLRGACNYQQTGLLQAYAAHRLVTAGAPRVGFASPCQAFGHRELLALLQGFGLMAAPQISGEAATPPLQPPAPALGSLNGATAPRALVAN
jgi:Family of unknown function (DUF5938)/Saccharopine dehydrogenase NADP binding domain